MSESAEVIKELEAILESMNVFAKVVFGRTTPLTEEGAFPSVYINMTGEGYKPNNIAAKGMRGYDVEMAVMLEVNTQSRDKYDHLELKKQLEDAILNDNKLWSKVLDRDLIMVEYDDNQSLPRKGFGMLISLVYRRC